VAQEAKALRDDYVDPVPPRIRRASLRGRILKKTAYLWQRASIKDQRLADLTEAEYQAESRILDAPEDAAAQDELRQVRQELERDQREEAARAPGGSSLLLHAVTDLQDLINQQDQQRPGRKADAADPNTLCLLRRTAQHLERASQERIDPLRFSDAVARLRHRFDRLQDQLDGGVRARDLEELLRRLEQRNERLLGRAGQPDPLAGAPDLTSSLENPEERLDKDNALSGLVEAMKTDDDIVKTLQAADSPEARQILRWLGLQNDDEPEAVRERIEALIYADYPTLLLDVLGRLRGFEDHLRVLEENFHDEQRPTPLFERLARPRKEARPNLEGAKDGHLVEIVFDPFQAEDLAEFELVVGLSRPLRQFSELRQTPPVMRLRKDDKLIERTYLRFDPDLGGCPDLS
jgi:hypothetical protein